MLRIIVCQLGLLLVYLEKGALRSAYLMEGQHSVYYS